MSPTFYSAFNGPPHILLSGSSIPADHAADLPAPVCEITAISSLSLTTSPPLKSTWRETDCMKRSGSSHFASSRSARNLFAASTEPFPGRPSVRELDISRQYARLVSPRLPTPLSKDAPLTQRMSTFQFCSVSSSSSLGNPRGGLLVSLQTRVAICEI